MFLSTAGICYISSVIFCIYFDPSWCLLLPMFPAGLNSQPVVSMVTQSGQDDMAPLILNTIDPNSLQLSPNLSPPLSLTQVRDTRTRVFEGRNMLQLI